jgi:hypothetical protein
MTFEFLSLAVWHLAPVHRLCARNILHERDAPFWHRTDLLRCLLSGRYRGVSRPDADITKQALMTRSGHESAGSHADI